MKSAIYPGSFDPITFGHLDIIRRAASVFDTLYVSVLNNSAKSSLFLVDERVNMIKDVTSDLDNVIVESFGGLTLEYALERNVDVLVRGLRAVSDFEYELQIAQTNREFSDDKVDTLFFITSLEYAYLSSSVVREMASYGKDISRCVPEAVAMKVYEKYGISPGEVLNIRGE